MKNSLFHVKVLNIIYFGFLLFCFSCEKSTIPPCSIKPTALPDSILAGQKSGEGIYYVYYEPDISLSLVDWDQTDTSIILDMNSNGIDDFIFERTVSPHAYMGGGFEKIKIISLDQNEIIVIPAPYQDTVITPCMHSPLDWVDTLSVSAPIGTSNVWISNECLIFYYAWDMQGCNIHDGFWPGIYTPNDKFIGFKIVKDELNYFGWIGFYRDNETNVFKITDYAITQEYEID